MNSGWTHHGCCVVAATRASVCDEIAVLSHESVPACMQSSLVGPASANIQHNNDDNNNNTIIQYNNLFNRAVVIV